MLYYKSKQCNSMFWRFEEYLHLSLLASGNKFKLDNNDLIYFVPLQITHLSDHITFRR